MVMWNWPVGQPSGAPMNWSQWQTQGTGAPGWYYDINGMLRYQPVPGSARVVGEGGPELEQNYIDPLTGRLVVNVMPMMGGQGQNPMRERFQDFRQRIQERFPQAEEWRTRMQEMQQQWQNRMQEAQQQWQNRMQPPQQQPAGTPPPPAQTPAPAPPQTMPQRPSWMDRMRQPMLPGGEEGPRLQGQRGQGGMRWFFPQGAAGPAVPGMQQGGQLTAPLPGYITNLFSGNPQGMLGALGGLFQGFQAGRGRQTGGQQGGVTQAPPAASTPPPQASPPQAAGSTPGQPFGGVWPPPEAPGTMTINRYRPEDLGNQPFIQTLRGQPRPAFQGFGAPLSNPALGIENMPMLNLQRYYELSPSEQAQTESLYGQGLRMDFRDLLEAAFRASPQAMQRRPTFYGG